MMGVPENFPESAAPGGPDAKQQRFSPYANNAGSVVAIAGEDYAVIGANTRLSAGYSILTREQIRLFRLSQSTVLGAAGCWADTLLLTRLLKARIQMYQLDHNKSMTTQAIAQMLSTILYYKRFFPYFVNNILAGLDDEGKGCVYNYDPIGHCERTKFSAGGSAGAHMQPLLDNQIGLNNMQNVTEAPIPKDKAVALLKDVFISAAERDIFTGDCIDILMITASGVQEERFELRKD